MNDLIIIGSGPAGLTAAIYAGRAMMKPIVFAGKQYGGQLTTTTIIENYPGFPDGILGSKLMLDMAKQAENYGTTILQNNVESVDFSGEEKIVVDDQGREHKAKSVIIASGAAPKTLGVPGEWDFYGKGVSTCATCDGFFYKDKVVAVIGGGDSAMEESSYLAKIASKVYVIHRRDEFRAGKIMQERILNNPKVEILWNTEVKEVVGDKDVDSLKLFNNKNNTESELKVDGMFLSIGHTPNTKFLEGHIELDEKGYVKVLKGNTITSVEGVFVAGDANDHEYRQAITAAGMGCMAAMDAEKWVK